jgi:hypothetical protein
MTYIPSLPMAEPEVAATETRPRSEGARPAPHPRVGTLAPPAALGIGYAARRQGESRTSNPYAAGQPRANSEAAALWDQGFRLAGTSASSVGPE